MDCPILCINRNSCWIHLLHPDSTQNNLKQLGADLTPLCLMKKISRNTILGKVITYSSIGIQVGLTVGIGIICGVYLDQWLGTGPWLTILGLLVGVISGFTRLFQIGKDLSQK